MKGACAAALVLAGSLWTAPPSSPTRVLFVGNSYTYYNNLPAIFRVLAESGADRRVEVRMAAPGGWRLRDHWEKGEARELLRTAKWDYVVLQDQSTLGVNYFVEGTVHVSTDEVFRPYAERWASAIRTAGARTVFYLTWARRGTPEDQAALSAAYIRAARSTRSTLAPVGTAWKEIRDLHPDIDLFQADGSHPSPAGSYLVACVLFATIFNEDPLGLPARIMGPPVNLKTEQIDSTTSALLVDLPDERARILQRAAWSTWKRARKTGGYLPVPTVAIPDVPKLPVGPPLGNLTGRWSGKLRFYPAGPVDMILRIASPSKGHLDIRHHSTDLADETFELTDLMLVERTITFSVRSPGVDNLRVAFRGIGTPEGRLRGTAVTNEVGRSGAPVRLIGTWELARP